MESPMSGQGTHHPATSLWCVFYLWQLLFQLETEQVLVTIPGST